MDIDHLKDSEENDQDSSNEDETENEKDENAYSDSDFSAGEEDHETTNDGDDAVFGEFEDLETGQKFNSHHADDLDGADKDENSAAEERKLKKLALRAKFDAKYDGAEFSDEEDDDNKDTKSSHGQSNGSGFFVKLKEKIELRKQVNMAELNELDDITRTEIEGYRTGTYLRLEFMVFPVRWLKILILVILFLLVDLLLERKMLDICRHG